MSGNASVGWKARSRAKFLELCGPFLLWVGRLHLPFTLRRVHQWHVDQALALLEPGDVILTAERGAITNILIPGDFTHVTIYSPDPIGRAEVVEAVGGGVGISGLWELLLGHKDRFAIVRAINLTKEQRCSAARFARTLKGRRYDTSLRLAKDYGHDEGDAEIYCAELPVIAFLYVDPNFAFCGGLDLGVWTVEPQDFFDQREHFALIYDSAQSASPAMPRASAPRVPA